jgi:hypothetical protein
MRVSMKVICATSGICLILILSFSQSARAEDYLILKNGQTIKCAILRQDTAAVFTTDWNLRSMLQPPLQVYTRQEVESIWFDKPKLRGASSRYVPRPGQVEAGGSVVFETFADSEWPRSYGGVISGFGGITILPQISSELETDYAFGVTPHDDQARTWLLDKTVQINVLAHPFLWKGMVPYVLGGGGVAFGPPGAIKRFGNTNRRELLAMGLGIKTGSSHIGYRLEWRHNLYNWRELIASEARNGNVVEQTYHWFNDNGNLSSIRATIFAYW